MQALVDVLVGVLAAAILGGIGWLIQRAINRNSSALEQLQVQVKALETTQAVMAEQLRRYDVYGTQIQTIDRNQAVLTSELEIHQRWHATHTA